MQHRQEAEVAAAETAATAARATRLAMTELAAARAEVEAAAVDAARATVAELEALHASRTGNSVFADDDRDNELKLARETAWEQAAQWAAAHLQGRRGGSPDGHGRAGGAPSRGARGGRIPDGGGSPNRHGRAGGWVDGDRGLYRRRGSPSLDRYHGIQAIVRDVGPDGGWPTLTKTNYVEWAAVMRVRLQVRHMWEAVRYDDVNYYEDRRALDALIAAVSSEMQFSLSLRHASATTAPARPRYRHFTRSGRTWPSSQVRTVITSLSVLTLCSRRWCSSATTPTARRGPSRSSSGASPTSTSRSLARSSLCWTSP
jgi:hypothetical protein